MISAIPAARFLGGGNIVWYDSPANPFLSAQDILSPSRVPLAVTADRGWCCACPRALSLVSSRAEPGIFLSDLCQLGSSIFVKRISSYE